MRKSITDNQRHRTSSFARRDTRRMNQYEIIMYVFTYIADLTSVSSFRCEFYRCVQLKETIRAILCLRSAIGFPLSTATEDLESSSFIHSLYIRVSMDGKLYSQFSSFQFYKLRFHFNNEKNIFKKRIICEAFSSSLCHRVKSRRWRRW